ncbi:MAG: Sugar kinase, ribokinase [Parcubacteria group bacterium GW2011_GWA2_51_10]|nr:MAG: Sugar kinase, ribokinase [Parcubacteria group bacterium GW2011_GWA2_51_10]
MSNVIVSGSLAYDRIMDYNGLFADHFVPDKIHSISLSFTVDRMSVEFGGTAGNIAYNLALLGEKPAIIATAGTDFGSYKSHLLLSGIDPTTIRIVEGEMTSSAVVLTDKADNQIAAFHPGAGGHAYDTPVETDGRVLAIIAPGCISDMTSLPDYYRRKGLKYLYDPGQQILSLSSENLQDGLTGAHILFASDYEFGLIAQKTGWAEGTILEHVSTIVVTYGAEGSRIVTREGETRVAAAPVKDAIDPTGAGDAYRAGFVKGMLRDLPYTSCAKLGSIVASYAVEAYGTQTHRFTLDDVAARYKSAYGEKVALV